jgi:hypothetical protein
MSTVRKTDYPIQIGDVVVHRGAIGGPAMRVIGFGHLGDVTQPGPSARVESLRPADDGGTRPAWMGEFLLAGLRILPAGHRATTSPFYAFGAAVDATDEGFK